MNGRSTLRGRHDEYSNYQTQSHTARARDDLHTGTTSLSERLEDMSRTVLDEPAFVPRIHSDPIGFASSDIIDALSSPEDGIKKSLIIDMKDLVGDAVGNVRSV